MRGPYFCKDSSFQNSYYCFHNLQCVSLVYPINCTENQFKSLKTPGLCCKLCSAGEFMSKECEKAGIETTCLPCPKNEFTRTPNNLSSCKKCRDVSACDGGRYPVQDCTPTSDIQCACPVNKYWNTHTFWCEECTVCERGERLISPCGTYKDAVCEKCQQVCLTFKLPRAIKILILLTFQFDL